MVPAWAGPRGVRILFLFFSVVYVSDAAITTYGLERGVVEGNPLARTWYEGGSTVALGIKAIGLGFVSLGVVALPRLWPRVGDHMALALLIGGTIAYSCLLAWNMAWALDPEAMGRLMTVKDADWGDACCESPFAQPTFLVPFLILFIGFLMVGAIMSFFKEEDAP